MFPEIDGMAKGERTTTKEKKLSYDLLAVA